MPTPPSSYMATQRLTPQSRAMPAPPMPPASTTGGTATRPSAAASNDASTTRLQAFRCFERTWHRLRWQLIGLSDSYRRALASAESGFTLQDAEFNFKLDFHGFYASIEQASVSLLHIFKVSLPSQPLRSNRRMDQLPSILKALNRHCSLRATLGTGDTSRALWTAYELGNKWKNPEDVEGIPSLRMYNLPWIVVGIMTGLEAAYMAAVKEVEIPMGKQREAGQTYCLVDSGADPMDWEPTGPCIVVSQGSSMNGR